MSKNKFSLPLINAHAHAAMIAFRGLVEDLPLDIWLKEHIWPKEKEMVNPDFVYKNTIRAIKEMKENGIKVFCDMYFFESEVARAAEKEKMGVVIGEALLDFPTPSAKNPQQALENTEKLIKKYRNHPFISVSVAPHSIYTLSKTNLIKAKKLSRKYDTIYQIHIAETKKEVSDCKSKWGLSPIEYLDKIGVLDEKTLLIHCVWVGDKDIELIAKRYAKVVHCPLSNMKLGSGIAPVTKMLNKKITVALGTDGAASSNRLDIWEAGKFAGLVQKVANLDASAMPSREIVKMMSMNGMRSLRINEIGKADIVAVENTIKNGNYSYIYHQQSRDLF